MIFSKACQYAIQGVLYIAIHEKEGKSVGLREISKSQDVPHHFLSKVLQKLVHNDILSSTKGPGGGFKLKIPADKLKLVEVVRIIDGLDIFDVCGIGLKACSDVAPCPIHREYKVVKDKIKQILQEKTLAELCEDVELGKSIVSFKK